MRCVACRAEITSSGRFPPGTLLAERYRIISLAGRGGMGEVYRATDIKLNHPVALKFLPPNVAARPGLLERFHGEVRIARQVSHPNVCRVYDIGEAEGSACISMEYVDGEDLGSLLRRIGRLPPDKGLEIARKLCAGLAASHARGVLHRDLKPGNIMIDGRGQVLIMDFGLAALADTIAARDVWSETPAYMAPEQLKGKEVSERSDSYALGLVLHEVFTGQRAFKSEDRSAIPRAVSVVKDIDPVIDAVIACAMGLTLRFGIPAVLMFLFSVPESTSPMTPDLSAWYASRGLVVMGLALALAAWSFRHALGGRKVLKGDLFEP